MDTKEIVKNLNSLIQLDIDAYMAYGEAIKEVDVSEVKERLVEFRADHERHVKDLSNEVRALNGNPPDFSPDFKGFFIQGFTSVTSKGGTEAALRAMQGNEKLTNATYSKAAKWGMPANIMRIIEVNYSDEQTHLAYIEDALDRRLWESKKAA